LEILTPSTCNKKKKKLEAFLLSSIEDNKRFIEITVFSVVTGLAFLPSFYADATVVAKEQNDYQNDNHDNDYRNQFSANIP